MVSNGTLFEWRLKLAGKTDEILPGRYVLAHNMSYGTAIDRLTSSGGKINVTIPEGEDRTQIARHGQGPRAERRLPGGDARASRASTRTSYGAQNPKSLEGFLFPATYELDPGASVDQLVSEQLQAFQQNIAGVDLSYAKSKNLTVYDVLTIASMIDKEVQVPSERPLVAAVIYNRLHRGMPLGIDATTRYEFHNYTGEITAVPARSPPRRTTRALNAGLPPTPIGNPGLAAIQAAAHPAKVNYLYYVVKATAAASTASRPARPSSTSSSPPTTRAGRRRELPSDADVRPAMKRLAVLGHPVSHSRSPAMQNAALEALGLAGEWSYEAIDLRPDGVRRADAGAARAGVRRRQRHRSRTRRRPSRSPTRPPTAAQRDRRRQHAQLRGRRRSAPTTPTPPGLLAALPEPVEGRAALVLGAGGSARAAVWALAGRGRLGVGLEPHRRSGPTSWSATSPAPGADAGRGPARGGQRRAGARRRLRADRQLHRGRDARRGPVRAPAARPRALRRGDRPRRSRLRAARRAGWSREARAAGATAVDGLEVLVRQGAESLRIWTGMEPPLDVMREAARRRTLEARILLTFR